MSVETIHSCRKPQRSQKHYSTETEFSASLNPTNPNHRHFPYLCRPSLTGIDAWGLPCLNLGYGKTIVAADQEWGKSIQCLCLGDFLEEYGNILKQHG